MPLMQDQIRNMQQQIQQQQATQQAVGQSNISPANQIMQKYGMSPIANPGQMKIMPGQGGQIGGGTAPLQDLQSARQSLIGPRMPMQATAGRPMGTATGMGMTPPSRGAFNPMFNNLNRGGGMPFDRQRADGVMRKYGMGGGI